MPQTLTIDSQVPDNLVLSLSWGELVETPPREGLVRLAEGETFTIPEGHATSIRTKDGWQRGYAFADTMVTGPVDVSTPVAMTRREFAPHSTISTNFFTALMMAYLACSGLFALSITQNLAPYGLVAMFVGFFAACAAITFSLFVVIRVIRRQDEKLALHACAEISPKTFWREDLIWVQSQPIRAAGTVLP